MKKYFHEITEAGWEKVKKKSWMWSDVRKKYKGPPWCVEAKIVVDAMGCWSLIAIGEPYRITKEDDCKKCPLYRGEKDENRLNQM